jgi:hypothetical protein
VGVSGSVRECEVSVCERCECVRGVSVSVNVRCVCDVSSV